jgi:hypothetical protein
MFDAWLRRAAAAIRANRAAKQAGESAEQQTGRAGGRTLMRCTRRAQRNLTPALISCSSLGFHGERRRTRHRLGDRVLVAGQEILVRRSGAAV